jgi:hypothetical protein
MGPGESKRGGCRFLFQWLCVQEVQEVQHLADHTDLIRTLSGKRLPHKQGGATTGPAQTWTPIGELAACGKSG